MRGIIKVCRKVRRFMGTYNYYGPTQPQEHYKYDVELWVRYAGNIDNGYTIVF